MVRLIASLAAVLLLAPARPALAADTEARDHPLLSRMPGFEIDEAVVLDFDQVPFAGAGGRGATVEGKHTTITYVLDAAKAAKAPSEAQIVQNHVNALRKLGGAVVAQDERNAWLEVKRGGATTWVHVRARDQGEAYVLDIVEGKAMAQEVTADAGALAADIAATGKAAVYGIYFDTGKAEVKPESRPALEQIAAVLVRDPSLRLHVVGHTDAVGDVAMNLKLSQARAEAVVKELTTRHGVAAARLRPAGVGPLAPAASNRDEAGRARNRRVELVAW